MAQARVSLTAWSRSYQFSPSSPQQTSYFTVCPRATAGLGRVRTQEPKRGQARIDFPGANQFKKIVFGLDSS